MFYARFSPLLERSGTKPELMLDILPGSEAHAFTVYFRNAPLAKTKVMVYAPNFWMQEHPTDENGKVKITTPWLGQYVLEAIYLEKPLGEFQGQKFEAFRHRATLTFNIPASPNYNHPRSNDNQNRRGQSFTWNGRSTFLPSNNHSQKKSQLNQ